MALERELSSSSQNSSEPRRGLLYTLLAASAFLVGLFSSRFRSQEHQQHENTIRQTGETECQRGNHNIRLDVTVRDTEDVIGQRRTEADKQYRVQNSIRKATWGAFIAASLYAGISVLVWMEMQTQTSNQWKAKIDAERPWVAVNKIFVASDVKYTGGGTKAVFTLGYVLNNSGHSPAFVKIYGTVVDTHISRELIKFCDDREAEVFGKGKGKVNSALSYISIPGSPGTYYIPDQPTQTLLIHKEEMKNGYFHPYSVGCVFYLPVTAKSDEVPKETRFYGEITTVDRDGNPPPAYESKGVRLEQGNLPIEMKKLCVIDVFPTQVAD